MIGSWIIRYVKSLLLDIRKIVTDNNQYFTIMVNYSIYAKRQIYRRFCRKI